MEEGHTGQRMIFNFEKSVLLKNLFHWDKIEIILQIVFQLSNNQ